VNKIVYKFEGPTNDSASEGNSEAEGKIKNARNTKLILKDEETKI
jgi:hypothetical protein